jgi:16S rRNA (guanine966-N2)-methyltransferase
VRIISGRFKGRRLVSFQAKHIRPTTDRVKETLFNKLMGYFPDARVLDLFAGTGNLGLESLSRGAAHVAFVDDHPKSLAVLRENLAELEIRDGYKIHSIDVFKFLKRYEGDDFNVIFADPPFTERLAERVMAAIALSKVWAPGAVIAIESGTKEPISDDYGRLNLLDRKKFGDKTLSLFEARV